MNFTTLPSTKPSLLRIICMVGILWPAILQAQIKNTPIGSLNGYITDAQGEGVAGATIFIKGSREAGTATDNTGYFELQGLPVGDYELKVSFVGMKAAVKKIRIQEETTRLNIQLQEKNEELDDLIIAGTGLSAIAKEESPYVARLPISNMENPQIYHTVSEKLMKEQVATDLDGMLKNIPGAGVPVRFNQNRITFLSRGFATQPKIRNGLTSFMQTYVDPSNLERIEVLKGPSSTLFGSSVISYGGLLNRVTKSPQEEVLGSVTYTGGSWNLNRIAFDYNTPVNDSKTLLFRINGALHNENSFQDAGFNKVTAFSPSLTYKLSDKTTLRVEAEYTGSKGTSPIRLSPYTSDELTTISVEDMNWPYKRSFASNDIHYTSESLNIFARLEHQLSENWTSQTSVSRTKSVFDGFTTRQFARSATTFRTRVTEGQYAYYTTDLQQNFIGKFQIGSLKNRMVVGVDYYEYYADRDIANVNLSTYEYGDAGSGYYSTYNRPYIDSLLTSASRTIRNQTTRTYSAYASDVINITDRLLAMASLRFDYFRDEGTLNMVNGNKSEPYEQAALSPKFGLVYQILNEKLSAFGNYMNGFSNQNGSDEEGNSFDPEHANQWELGIKADLFEHKLAGSVSYYDIKVENILRTDPDNADFSVQDGARLSKGWELELTAEPLPNLTLLAGYAYNDSEYTKADESIDGLRPAEAGPKSLANVWASYQLPMTDTQRLKFGVGGNYGSSSFQTNTNEAQVTIPSYTTVDAMIGYEVKNLSFSVKANNLTNEKYWSYRLAPQKPRNFLASVNVHF